MVHGLPLTRTPFPREPRNPLPRVSVRTMKPPPKVCLSVCLHVCVCHVLFCTDLDIDNIGSKVYNIPEAKSAEMQCLSRHKKEALAFAMGVCIWHWHWHWHGDWRWCWRWLAPFLLTVISIDHLSVFIQSLFVCLRRIARQDAKRGLMSHVMAAG